MSKLAARVVLISCLGTTAAHANTFGGGFAAGSGGPHALGNDGTFGYEYDQSGNALRQVYPSDPSLTRRLSYTASGQLRSVARGLETTRTVYDAEGKKIATLASGEVYAYLPSARVKRRGQGGVPTLLLQYGEAELGEDRSLRFFVQDHLDSILAIASATRVEQLRDYQPYGNTWYTRGPQTTTDRAFHGNEVRADVLDYAARQMIPGTGVFLQADTLVPDEHEAASYNRYAYVRSNPVNRIDPDGHAERSQAITLVGRGALLAPFATEYLERHPNAHLYDRSTQAVRAFDAERALGVGPVADASRDIGMRIVFGQSEDRRDQWITFDKGDRAHTVHIRLDDKIRLGQTLDALVLDAERVLDGWRPDPQPVLPAPPERKPTQTPRARGPQPKAPVPPQIKLRTEGDDVRIEGQLYRYDSKKDAFVPK